jgi:hypothetical protein
MIKFIGTPCQLKRFLESLIEEHGENKKIVHIIGRRRVEK